MMLASLVLAAALPATPAPLHDLHDLVGRWNCTHRTGAVRMTYEATYAYERDGHTLRESASWAGGGYEEFLAWDLRFGGWTAVVLDEGSVTVLRGGGSPQHRVFHSVYPDDGITEAFDRLLATQYVLKATVRSRATSIFSLDTCVRAAQ